MTAVDIYEDNGGAIALHAEGGSCLYQGGIEDLPGEARHVAEHPNGDEMNWSPELQHPWLGEVDSWTYLGAWRGGKFEASDRKPGHAGTLYLATAPSGLIALRKHLGLSQQALADALGVDHVTVYRWETGRRSIPPFLGRALWGMQ